ncbi:MAG: type II toxin-antitoxin system prevent-host-death family antitoxin [Actinomycetota bacterium]
MEPADDPGHPPIDTAGLDRVGIRQLRNSVSGLVKRAAAGERIVITVDGRPMAQLGPLGAGADATLDDMAAAGLIEPPRQPGPSEMPPPLAIPADVRLDRLLDQIRGRS